MDKSIVMMSSRIHPAHLVSFQISSTLPILYLSTTMASKPMHPAQGRLECPVCLEEFTDPLMLPCLHTLCRHCIEGLVSASAQKVQCPACLYECQVPREGVSGFPKNFFLNDAKELLRELKELRMSGAQRSGQRLCDNTKHDNKAHGVATAFCADCAEFYCETCIDLHKMFGVTRGHKLRPTAEVDPSTALATKARKRTLKCGEHSDTILDFYCDTCHIPVCAKCCLLTHKQHQYRDMTAVGKEYKKKLEDFIQGAEVHVSKVRGQLKKLKASSHSIQQDTDKARHEVKQAANEMRDLVTEREQYLLQEIQDIEVEALAAVILAQEDTELKIASTESLLFYMQALHASGDVTDQLVHTPDVQKQLQQQQAEPLSTVEWTASFKTEANRVAALNAMLGTGDYSPKEVKLGQPLNVLKHDLGDVVSGLVVVNGCLCVTASGAPDLCIYNTVRKVIKTYTIRGLDAVGLAAIRDTGNTLVIADYWKKLHFVTFNQHNMKITRHTVKNITFKPRHISIHPVTGQLVIGDYINKAIVVCDTQGNVQNTVTMQTKAGYMQCAVATDDGYVTLDNSNLGRLHWVDNQGRVTQTYCNREGEGLCNPRHMVRTSWGQLVVADIGNSRIHLVDASGGLSCYLLTGDDGIEQPHCVWLDEATSLLYVAHRPGNHKEIWVCKWHRNISPMGVYVYGKWPRLRYGLHVTVGPHK